MSEIMWPFGEAQTEVMAATGTTAIEVTDMLCIIDGATTEATGNSTLNLTIDEFVKAGAIILLSRKTDDTETLTFGTGITDVVHTGVAGKTFTAAYMYNGTTYLPMGELQQID